MADQNKQTENNKKSGWYFKVTSLAALIIVILTYVYIYHYPKVLTKKTVSTNISKKPYLAEPSMDIKKIESLKPLQQNICRQEAVEDSLCTISISYSAMLQLLHAQSPAELRQYIMDIAINSGITDSEIKKQISNIANFINKNETPPLTQLLTGLNALYTQALQDRTQIGSFYNLIKISKSNIDSQYIQTINHAITMTASYNTYAAIETIQSLHTNDEHLLQWISQANNHNILREMLQELINISQRNVKSCNKQVEAPQS